MDCHYKKAGPKEQEKDLTEEERRKRIEWMHRETYI